MSSQFTLTDLARRAALLMILSWSAMANAQSLERVLMPGKVIQGHLKYEEQCEKCHETFNKAAQAKLCVDCHKLVGADIEQKLHLHGHLVNTECRECHTDHKGRGAKIVPLDEKTFDHKSTGLELKGAHQKALREKCSSCHLPRLKRRAAPPQCDGCHAKDDVHRGALGQLCAQCHSEETWKEGKFDHDKTRYRLDGKHAKTTCKQCHADTRYRETPHLCVACHQKDDMKTGHKGSFGTKCEKCHATESWKVTTFNHTRDTHFQLLDKHEKTACVKCHTTTLFVPPATPSACYSCHRQDDDKNGHRGTLGERCETCHGARDWKTTSFDHDRTDYRLVGTHRKVRCEACHTTGLKPLPGQQTRPKLPTVCSQCHQKADQEKGHKGKFGSKCETCHDTIDWKKSLFNHDKATRYPLRGKHHSAKCESCHRGMLYVEKLDSLCVSCHRVDDQTKGHKGGLGTLCQDCHSETDWKVERFNHAKSRFPLTGSHVIVECKKCHATPAFREAPMACNSCHEKVDQHKGRFGTNCESCHYTGTWKAWDFDHSKTTFSLDGAHLKVNCDSCHQTPFKTPSRKSRTCISCHAKDDVHYGGFSAQCERCHGNVSWKSLKMLRRLPANQLR